MYIIVGKNYSQKKYDNVIKNIQYTYTYIKIVKLKIPSDVSSGSHWIYVFEYYVKTD